MSHEQGSLSFGIEAPQDIDRGTAQRALDELFDVARQYRSAREYVSLLRFIKRFRFYSPYNAMLVHVQMHGATFVATPNRWMRQYQRRIKTGARPLVILQPMGPVLFVFDVSDTEPEPGAPPLPREVERPFEVERGHVGPQFEMTVENAKRDGICILDTSHGSQSAGAICRARPGSGPLLFQTRTRPEPEHVSVPRRYELIVNSELGREARYATVVHELAHLYCGHLGTPNPEWWPDRRHLDRTTREFEAESVAYLVCARLNVDNRSAAYLSGYVRNSEETPRISLDCVLKATGLVETMGRERLKARKERKRG